MENIFQMCNSELLCVAEFLIEGLTELCLIFLYK